MKLTPTRLHVSGLMMALLFALFTALPQAARATRFEEEKPASASASRAVVLRGRASWYGREHQGHRTSNGERFDRFKYTCAHKTLPFGTKLRVTNPTNGKSVVVRVSDRGPFRHQRILDLSEVAARPLDIVRRGAVSVVAEVVPSDTPLGPTDAPENLAALASDSAVATLAAVATITDVAAGATEAADVVIIPAPVPTFVVQAGTFGDPRNAQTVQAKIQALDEKLTVTIAESTQNGKPYNRVIVGQFVDKAEAEAVKLRLKELGIAGLVRQAENL